MNFHFPFRLFSKPDPIPHVVIKHYAATKAENREARLRRETVANDLRCLVGDLTPSERKAAISRATDKQKAGRGA